MTSFAPVQFAFAGDALAVQDVGALVADHARTVELVGSVIARGVAVKVVTGTAQAVTTVPETEGELKADEPDAFVALTVYVWTEPKTSPVSEKARSGPLYTAVAPPSRYTW